MQLQLEINQLVLEIADRMRDPDHVRSLVLQSSHCHPDLAHSFPLWGGISLAGGYSGILLMFAELDYRFPDQNWDSAAHAYVLKIKEEIETKGISSLSLFGGLSGICFALRKASRSGTRYQKLIHTLDKYLLEKIEDYYFSPLRENLRKGSPSFKPQYDLMQGIAGVGVYGLHCLSDSALHSMVEEILLLLIGLTKPIQRGGRSIPGWYVLLEDHFLQSEKTQYPEGNFNLGLSHGVSGVLAFLSAAMMRGIVLEGQHEAIERITSWIQKHRREYNGIFFWNNLVSFEEEIGTTQALHPSFPLRDAWCYGTPGTAYSLFLAGKALKDKELHQFALDSFLSIFQKNQNDWLLTSPTCCHGLSGLLLLTKKITQETKDENLVKKASSLTQLLLTFHHTDYPFGFRNLQLCKGEKFAEVDEAGLLEGAAGVLLTLLSGTGKSSGWDAIFLID